MTDIIPGSSTGRATKVPAIPVVRSGNAELDKFALAVKEYIEVREGVRGNPYDRVATLRDITPGAATAAQSTTTGATQTTSAATDVSRVVYAESARLRSEIARAERNMRDAMNSFVDSAGDQLTAQAVQALGSAGRYTATDLANDLAAGAATVIAGLAAGTTIMKLDPSGQYVVFQHKDAAVLDTVGAYSGAVRTALGITSGGIVGGYNRQSDGAWQTTLAIESATGNLTVMGTIKADSVIEVGAYLGAHTVSSVLSDISNTALALDGKLDAQATYILGSDFSLKTDTFDAGTGLAITNNGIIAKAGGVNTVTITNTGDASFKGAVTAGSVIATSAYLGGSLVSVVLADVADASAEAAAATAALVGKLDAQATYILGDDFSLKTSTYDAGTGLAITNNGIIAKAGGVNTVTITNTGDASFKGAVTAGSVIATSAYLGTSLFSTVLGDISSAASTANSAYNLAQAKLDAQSTYILGTDFALKTASYDAGSGIIITDTGILGKKSGATTFAIDNTGAATFAGDVVTSGRLHMSGTGFVYGGSATQNTVAYLNATQTIYGLMVDSGGMFTTAIAGYSTGGNAVLGSTSGFGTGVFGYNSGSGPAVAGTNVGGGASLQCSGSFRWGSYLYSQPDGGTDKYLRNDGTWALVASLGGGTVTSVSGSGSVSGITLSGTVTTSGSLTLGGSLSLTAAQLTATAPNSGYFLSGGGWIPVTVVSTLNGASGNVSNSFAANNSIAGISITVSGSGTNSVTYNFSSTSDRSLKKDIADCDLGLAFVNQLRPVMYSWDTEHVSFAHRTYGLIANEVMDIMQSETSLVYQNRGGVFDGKLAVDYQSYVPVLVKAVQELSARVAQLESAHVA